VSWSAFCELAAGSPVTAPGPLGPPGVEFSAAAAAEAMPIKAAEKIMVKRFIDHSREQVEQG